MTSRLLRFGARYANPNTVLLQSCMLKFRVTDEGTKEALLHMSVGKWNGCRGRARVREAEKNHHHSLITRHFISSLANQVNLLVISRVKSLLI